MTAAPQQTDLLDAQSGARVSGWAGRWQRLRVGWLSVALFHRLIRLTLVVAVVIMAYWLFFASNRYVSEADIVIRKTDSASMPSFDLSMLMSGVSSINRADQLLLREYLLSTDMMKKLDARLDLRQKYSGWGHDPVSRFWFKDAPIEWLVRYLHTVIQVDYDELSGTLHISAQAYDPKTAHAITRMMVQDGEHYMNQLGHELAETQVEFLGKQVAEARTQFEQASTQLLNFQNQKGLLSPEVNIESISTIIANLESQRAQFQTRLESLPKTLNPSHPSIVMLKHSLVAVDRQIREERAKLTASSGGKLNTSLEQFQKLKMAVDFGQQLYKSALMALEKGRFDATRKLDKVSVLQSPTLPEYPLQPHRLYNAFVTLLAALVLMGILKLLEAIVRDHVD